MTVALLISAVRFSPSLVWRQRDGLLGYVSCVLNGHVILDGIALRRTAGGRLALAFPKRRDRSGKRHALIRPLDSDARQEIERQVFAALRDTGGLS